MIARSFEVRGFDCFMDWAGFSEPKPINIIIGRNNTGKSRLLDVVAMACESRLLKWSCAFRCSGVLDEPSLRAQFPESNSGGDLGGNFWSGHGKLLVGAPISWERTEAREIVNITCSSKDGIDPLARQGRRERVLKVLEGAQLPFEGFEYRHLASERDIGPEPGNFGTALTPAGACATNIIAQQIRSDALDSDLIEVKLVGALNAILGDDGKIDRMRVQQKDEGTPNVNAPWEIFLDQKGKGSIRLSKSGSGLKTIILVLLNLLVLNPKKPNQPIVFAFEELENNLHPALLRRLLHYVEQHVLHGRHYLFLTTHSSVVLDYFGAVDHAQIIRVSHDGKTASTKRVDAHLDKVDLIGELGAKPSDLLHANGVIWVEGPSDRIYLNRLIEIFTDGELREGRDYQCACYGGALLARMQIQPEEDARAELLNLFRINTNLCVVCDSDRPKAGAQLKDRVQRIVDEAAKVKAHVWVTGVREIENYVPGDAYAKALGKPTFADPEQFASFWPREKDEDKSFLKATLKRASYDKVDLAAVVAPHLTKENTEGRFDLEAQVGQLVAEIRKWNA